MELTVLERLVLLNVLPKEGDFTTLKLVRVAREALSFNDIENQKLKFVQDGEQVRWDEAAGRELTRDIELGEMMTIKIVEELKKLESEKKLRDDHFTLYEKFVENPPVPTPVKNIGPVIPEVVK